MPRSNNVVVQNNFIKGLLTQNTALTFPENACTETWNCVFDLRGQVTRRHPIDVEDLFSGSAKTLTSNAIATYLWTNVAGDGDVYFIVAQIGNTLYFYRSTSTDSLSAGLHGDTIDLTTFIPSTSTVTTVASLECQFSSGNGLLFVTNENLESFYVEYDIAGDSLSATQIDLEIRDFEGDLADALAVDNRPTSTVAGLSAAHHYNLLNQGWTATTLASWDTARTDMPSNCDVSWYFKNSSDAFDFSTVADRVVGNSAAPKGHYIYSLYDVDRTANVATATKTQCPTERVKTSAFYAGRVFYSGLDFSNNNARIFFTQIVQESSQYGKCYQTNDPTSQELFDLLPTDGGFIDLLEAGMIVKLMPALNVLLVFATNGIWAITGSQGLGFTANDYSIIKISSIRTISHTSFVDAEGVPYWWNLDGIYTVQPDPQKGGFSVMSITDTTIKEFYDDIPGSSKSFARGVHDPLSKTIQWIYRSTEATGFEENYVFDRMLNFNLLTGAFYPWSVGTGTGEIHSIVDVRAATGSFVASPVVNGADTVVSSTNPVVVFVSETGTTTSSKIKYFSSYNDGSVKVTFAEERTDLDTYVDWDNAGTAEDYDSYFITGYSVHGKGIKRFQSNYINVFSNNEVDNSFTITGLWNYATAASTMKWSLPQTFTNTSGNFSYKPRRIKIRGSGVACQFKIENNGTDPFNIVGWSVFETGNQWI